MAESRLLIAVVARDERRFTNDGRSGRSIRCAVPWALERYEPGIDLFFPIQMGFYELRHRIVMAPLTRNRAGQVLQAMNVRYYPQRRKEKVSGAMTYIDGNELSLVCGEMKGRCQGSRSEIPVS